MKNHTNLEGLTARWIHSVTVHSIGCCAEICVDDKTITKQLW